MIPPAGTDLIHSQATTEYDMCCLRQRQRRSGISGGTHRFRSVLIVPRLTKCTSMVNGRWLSTTFFVIPLPKVHGVTLHARS